MLIIPKKHADTLVLHVILGDESKYFMDIHGGIVIPIGQQIAAARDDGFENVLMMLTRCESERDTAQFLMASDNLLPVGADGKPMVLASIPRCDHRTPVNQATFQPPLSNPSEMPTAKCSYCGAQKVLMPLAGIKICSECVLIELKVKQATQLRETAVVEE